MNISDQPQHNKKRIQSLERASNLLYEKYEKLIIAKAVETDPANKFKIEKQIEDVEKQIEILEAELNKLNAHHQDPAIVHQNLHKNIAKLNYTDAIDLVDRTVSEFGPEGGAALFLLQNYLPMGGEWCLTRIKDVLKSQTGQFKPYQIQFTVEAQPDEFGLLNRLAPFFNIEPIVDSWPQFSRKIVDKIYDSVVSGSTIFFEINHWDSLAMPDHVLRLFLKEFWTPLIRSLPRLLNEKGYRRIKFVGIITANSVLPDTCFDDEFCCSKDAFCPEKFLFLELSHWTEDEISEWLELYSGLDGHRIDQIVPLVLNQSYNGVPRLVYDSLMTYLNPPRG